MHCFDCLLDRVGLTASSVGYRYINFGGKVVYLAGFGEILTLSEESMIFRLRDRHTIHIQGSGLTLREMDAEVAMVAGEIVSVEVK